MEEKKALDSWKEIASYLKRSVSTCHRWEEELGLPIHRLDGTPKAHVFAYADELDQWRSEKLNHAEISEKETGFLRPRKLRWLFISTGAVILVVGFGLLVRLFFPPALPPAPLIMPALAVLPFANATEDKTLEPWKTALPDLIVLDLTQSRYMNVDPALWLYLGLQKLKLLDASTFSLEDLAKVAEIEKVEYVATGSLIRSGEDIVINIQVQNPKTGSSITSLRGDCRSERGIFSQVDSLSRQIKRALNLTPRQISRDFDKDVARISTNSPQAFFLFSQASRLKITERIPLLKKAVELDPKFGRAYMELSSSSLRASRDEDRQLYRQKAIEFSDRVSEKERYRFLANVYMDDPFHKEPDKALKAYEKWWELFADDQAGLHISDIYFRKLEEWDKALTQLEKLSQKARQNPDFMHQLALCYQAKGLYDKAEKAWDDLLRVRPKLNDFYLRERCLLALVQKKYEDAHTYADMLRTPNPDSTAYIYLKGDVYFLQDDFANAEKVNRRLLEKDDPLDQAGGFRELAMLSLAQGKIAEAKERILAGIDIAEKLKDQRSKNTERNLHYQLAYLYRLTGNLPDALKEADAACQGGYERIGFYVLRDLRLRALITLELNRMEEFEKQVEEIRQIVEAEQFPRLMRVYYYLLGLRELKKNDYSGAVSYFWKALDRLSVLSPHEADADHASYFSSLAEAYYQKANLTGALEMYEKTVLPTVSKYYSGDIYAKSFYWMGKIHEKLLYQTKEHPGVLYTDFVKKYRTKAIENYRKFLALWNDADPIFPEVEEAKKALAKLESQD